MYSILEATKNFMIIVIISELMYSHKASGFISNTSSAVSCQGSPANIDFDFNLEGDSIASGSKVWYFNRIIIAEDTGTGFTALGNYSSRLTNHLSNGLTLSGVTTADAGMYDYDIFLVTGNTGKTVTTNLTVYVAPTPVPACSVFANQTGDTVTCYINTTGGSCGYPELHPGWVTFRGSPSFICTQAGTYLCCATGPAQTACLPSSSYCVSFNCSSTPPPPPNSTPQGKSCELELGLCLGLSLAIQCSITCIVVVIFMFKVCKDYTYPHKHGLLLGLGLGITFQVSWIIIVSLKFSGKSCELQIGLGLGLGSGIPYVIAIIIAVILVCIGNPRTVDFGKGLLKGLLMASVIGIFIVFLISETLKVEPPEPTGETPEEEPNDTKNKTKNKGSSALSRKDVQIQVEKQGVKSDEERPPAVHTGTQNKVESKTSNKQTNDRPLPSVDTVVQDTPKIRPQPQPPQNNDIKDRTQRGISATIDDTPGLPSETPRPIKLAPLPQKQPTVDEKDASEEPKKKRKKKKKKGQMNDGNPDEEMVQLKSTRALPGDQSDGD